MHQQSRIDEFNAYRVVVDRVIRYIWIFLATSKSPPVNVAQQALNKFKSKNSHRIVRTDQGDGLGKSTLFQNTVVTQEFSLEITEANTSVQNGVAEIPNRHLSNMMRLHGANLGLEYWVYALIDTVYIKNRFLHSHIKMTPYEALTGQQQNIIDLHFFGSRLYVRKLDERKTKLDNYTSNGMFAGYTATPKNV